MARKLSLNDLNDNMLKMAKRKGYSVPCISISQYYGRSAVFIEDDNGNTEISVYTHNALIDGKIDCLVPCYIHLIPAH